LPAGASVEQLTQEIRAVAPIEHLVWVAPAGASAELTDEAIITGQAHGVPASISRLIEALLIAVAINAR